MITAQCVHHLFWSHCVKSECDYFGPRYFSQEEEQYRGSKQSPTNSHNDRNKGKLLLSLTLNCIRYPALPLVHNGGFHGTPPEKTTFPPEFCNYLYTIYMYTNHNHISGKKYKIFVPFQNGGQITDFHFASFRFRQKFEKLLSQRNFSLKFGSN